MGNAGAEFFAAMAANGHIAVRRWRAGRDQPFKGPGRFGGAKSPGRYDVAGRVHGGGPVRRDDGSAGAFPVRPGRVFSFPGVRGRGGMVGRQNGHCVAPGLFPAFGLRNGRGRLQEQSR